ncbi:hypothetical protein M0722_01950 [Microbacterium sp. KSW4-16]|uniref:Uncharacterized protein n=1 Tax=Microbacterium aurugineum TaxID=2851642 RepID=A0ABY4J0T4_9MICO|nr:MULTISPECIES: hypothetical protein [Microbacterium]MCK8465942.1 hypothetical protein [Microbacterium aurugineum]QEA29645.1 hypothetical protein FGL91_14430 [Microbacterium sp. CBA3102]UPL17645.1 hypothetical protein KV397_07735 [Microbacterium aurugineum]
MSDLTIGVSAVTVMDGDQLTTFSYNDPDALIQALTDAFGSSPSITEDPNGYEVTFYDWQGARVLRLTDARASITISAPVVGGVNAATLEGIKVGSDRASALAGEARDVGEGADFLGITAREATNTQSLTRPGEVGLDFVRLRFSSDQVTHIQAPAFDYGDV